MPSYYSTKPRGRSNYSRYHSQATTRRKNPTKQYINPSKFVQAATIQTQVAYSPNNTFAEFDINPLIKRNVIAKRFITPTPIQDQAIPLALEGRDVIGIADTGTGKTAAFGIPLLHQLLENHSYKVLIMAPTRELALQINEDLKSYAQDSGLHSSVLIGGVNISPQIRELRARPRVIIGTPGRIKDHLERGTLRLSEVNKVVLDEVDRMLDMGFINDIRHILDQLPTSRQSLFFSATLDSKVAQLIEQFSNEPVTVSIKSNVGSESVNQNIVSYSSEGEQISKLHDILVKNEVEKVIIFDETKRKVERLNKELVQRGFKADAIHGGKSQGQRKRALDKFKSNHVSILVATDVAARGIDVSDITHVINYSTPQSYEDYIHRIGRTGRAGRIGHALTFLKD